MFGNTLLMNSSFDEKKLQKFGRNEINRTNNQQLIGRI